MKCKSWPVGVCSWSLRTDVPGVAKAMKEVGLKHVHLGIRAAVEDGSGKVLDTIKAQKWTITSTMIDFPQEDYSTLDTIKVTGGVVPDGPWEQQSQAVPRGGPGDGQARREVPVDARRASSMRATRPRPRRCTTRIRTLADIARDNGLTLLLETGQEAAPELRHFLEKLNHASVGVNFDPANMILYDKGDPIEAVRVLSPWIRHLHVKDALRTTKPGTWGSEVPWGDGQVGIERFLAVLGEVGFKGAMAIEREAGDNRLGDIKLAAQRLKAAVQVATSAESRRTDMFGMDSGLYLKLSAMMFLEFAVWGAWYPVLATRLLGPLKFSGKQTGWIYATIPLGCIFMPLLAGQVADQWINTELHSGRGASGGHAPAVHRRLEAEVQRAVHGDAAVRPVLCGDAARW